MPKHDVLHIAVEGVAQAQGSMVASRRGKVHHAGGGKLSNWRKTLGWTAKAAMATQPLSSPMVVYLHFTLPGDPCKPATRPPDLDKLIRAVLDALTGIVWVDDAQVCQCVAVKVYGDRPRVTIDVTEEHAWPTQEHADAAVSIPR
jgi:crossover junction endodeoxyribonuclease RusA